MSSKEIRKQVTDNPLVDEVIYECQIMIQGIVLKDQDKADEYENINSLKQADLYALIVEGNARFECFNYDYKIISKISSLPRDLCIQYSRDNHLIPDELKPTLLEFVKEDFLNHYQELNNYYRSLYGLPDLGEKGIHLTQHEISLLNIDEFDAGKFVHEMDNSEITILENSGVLDILISKYPEKSYLKHLGFKRIEPYIARKMPNFSVLYLPTVESTEVSNKFRERLEINRVYMLKTVYSEAYKYQSDYYDRFIMIMIVLQSLDDMIILSPEYLIQRELFDLRTIQFVFEASGVDFFPEIPMKYQKRLVKNLNRLIKFKSTDKNLLDISSLFGFENIELFKYYILKIPIMNEDGTYRHDTYEDPQTGQDVEDLEANYDLQFLRVPIDDIYDNYIRNKMNYTSYDTIASEDHYWTGVYTPEYVKHKILEHEFNVCVSKYISVDTVYSLTELSFELTYFINMLLYTKIDNTKLTVLVPEIDSKKAFPLIDLLITLYSLMYLYNGIKDNIIYDPVQAMAVCGFNFEVDMKELGQYVAEKGFTLEELGVSDFQIPKGGILTFNQLMEVYTKNKNIYFHIVHEINNIENKEMYDIYKKIFDSLMITKLNFQYFKSYSVNGKEPKTYKEFLANKNSGLYNIIDKCYNIPKKEEQIIEITKYINYIVENIYAYIDKEEFRYIFHGIPTVSMDYIRMYLFKIINFFKSYKVDIIHSNNIYVFDDKLDNKVRIIDDVIFRYNFLKEDKVNIDDFIDFVVHLNPSEKMEVKDEAYFYYTWWVLWKCKHRVPVDDKWMSLFVHLYREEYLSPHDRGIVEYVYNYLRSEIIKTEDHMGKHVSLTFNDRITIDDAMYLDITKDKPTPVPPVQTNFSGIGIGKIDKGGVIRPI